MPSDTVGTKASKPIDCDDVHSNDHQLFSESTFFFVPNSFKDKRKRTLKDRIQQYGGKVTNKFSDQVNYVLAAPGRTVADVLEYLDIREPPGNLSIISETWPPECISYGKLLNTNDFRLSDKTITSPPTKRKQSEPDAELLSSQKKQHKTQKAEKVDSMDSTIETQSTDTKGSDTQYSGEHNFSQNDNSLLQFSRLDSLQRHAREYLSDADSDSGFSYDSDSSEAILDNEFYQSNNKNKDVKRRIWIESFLELENVPDHVNHPANDETVVVLSLLERYYQSIGDRWRALAYHRASTSVAAQTVPITSAKQAKELDGVGQKIAEKIENIANHQSEKVIGSIIDKDKMEVLELFQKIHGVGPSIAMKWYNEGCRTLDDIKQRSDLSAAQQVGIRYFDELVLRIPRAEVKNHYAFIKGEAAKLDASIDALCMGSYRRGESTSGDIDIILTKDGMSLEDLQAFRSELVTRLHTCGYIIEILSDPEHTRGTFMSIVRLKSCKHYRRLDILCVPGENIGAALIYYTGNIMFQRAIKMVALKMGYILTTDGLYDRKKYVTAKHASRQERSQYSKEDYGLIESKSEKKIFEILDIRYREPSERSNL
ncbi:hypothetical protein CANCADRAFT_1110 [Tortispora caseinolytica NRRL Y-17796]|uniref:DNA polymerase n=1 Tax=Tortispora caseinolytica NRRL Y-17796 TaxID=767744 RepID=A0A1E4TL72_9ASCO|nr:hypothetical protein CANCADRAFT_1110 [Tortispora caseinolytica NRRL Y-17796]